MYPFLNFQINSLYYLLFIIPPQEDTPTLSTGTLKKPGLFKDIIKHRHSKLVLVDRNDKHIFVPIVTKDQRSHRLHLSKSSQGWAVV